MHFRFFPFIQVVIFAKGWYDGEKVIQNAECKNLIRNL